MPPPWGRPRVAETLARRRGRVDSDGCPPRHSIPIGFRPAGGHVSAARSGSTGRDGPSPATTVGTSSTVPRDPRAPVRVLTVDDQARFRGVARDVIEATPGFDLVGEAESGEEALLAVDRLAPELVLLDVRLPGLDGIEVARRLTMSHPETLVVLISIEDPVDLPSAAQLDDAVPLVRKQDFGPGLLRRLWAERRS